MKSMIEKLQSKGYIINESNGLDWLMHKDTKEVRTTGKGEVLNEMFKVIPKNKEYMVVQDYKDDKGYEFSIIIKDEDKIYFVTDDGTFHKEVE